MQEETENGIKIVDNFGNNKENHQKIIEALKCVFDPDIHYSIYDMGLIYEIHIEKEKIHIIMTLTSVNCPAAESLPADVKLELELVSGFENWDISVEVVFEPNWTVDNMTDEIKLRLGLL